jgi:8-oxo-dGTP pyrophosphatase MutT (NUDIX family)
MAALADTLSAPPHWALAPGLASADLVVARAVVERDGRILLVRRAAWDSLPGAWELPGGKVDAAETPELAVVRELAEETALAGAGAPDAWFALPLRSPSGRQVLERVYRVRASGSPRLSSEHDALVWQDPLAPPPGPLTESASVALGVAPIALVSSNT